MTRRTRLLIKPKVGPPAAPSGSKPAPVGATPACLPTAENIPALTSLSSNGQTEPPPDENVAQTVGVLDNGDQNATAEAAVPVTTVEEKTSTRLKRAGPRIPPPKQHRSSSSAPIVPITASPSEPAPAELVPADTVLAPNSSQESHEGPNVHLVDTAPDELQRDKQDAPAVEASFPIAIETPSKQLMAKTIRPPRTPNDFDPLASLPPRLERKAARRADEFREMLIASRRKFAKVKEPVDTSKLTMLDLIYYNPPGAPMTRHLAKSAGKDKEQRRGNGSIASDVQQSLEPELEDELSRGSTMVTRAAVDAPAKPTPEVEDEEEEVVGPRVVVAADGSIQIDEASLIIRRPNPEDQRHNLKVTIEEPGKTKYDSFKRKKTKKCTWTTRETSKFYRALSICGTDFTLMTQFFPTRSRQDLKNKFKREEKSNAALVDKAIHHPTQFEYTEGELEDILRDDEQEPVSKKPREPKTSKGKMANGQDGGKEAKGTKGGKRAKRRTKKEPQNDEDNRDPDEDYREGDEVGFRNGIIEDAMARPRRKKTKIDYAEMNEGAPEDTAPYDEEDRNLEVVEEDTAADNYVLLDDHQQAPQTPSAQPAVPVHEDELLGTSAPRSAPVTPTQLTSSIFATDQDPQARSLHADPATTVLLPNPQVLPPGLEPGQLVLFAPHGDEKALHLFVVNPPSAERSRVPAEASPEGRQVVGGSEAGVVPETEDASLSQHEQARAESSMVTEALPIESSVTTDTASTVEPGTACASVAATTGPTIMEKRHNECLALTATPVAVQPSGPSNTVLNELVPKATLKSQSGSEPSAQNPATVSNKSGQSSSAAAVTPCARSEESEQVSHAALERAADDQHTRPSEKTLPKTSTTARLSGPPATAPRRPLPKVTFKSRVRKGSIPPAQAPVSETVNTPVEASEAPTQPKPAPKEFDCSEPLVRAEENSSKSLTKPSSYDVVPSKNESMSTATGNNSLREKGPAILSRRKIPLVRKSVTASPKARGMKTLKEPNEEPTESDSVKDITASTGEKESCLETADHPDNLLLTDEDTAKPEHGTCQQRLDETISIRSPRIEGTTQEKCGQLEIQPRTDPKQLEANAGPSQTSDTSETENRLLTAIQGPAKIRRSSQRVVTPLVVKKRTAALTTPKSETAVNVSMTAESSEVVTQKATTTPPGPVVISGETTVSGSTLPRDSAAPEKLDSVPATSASPTTPLSVESPQDPTLPSVLRTEADIATFCKSSEDVGESNAFPTEDRHRLATAAVGTSAGRVVTSPKSAPAVDRLANQSDGDKDSTGGISSDHTFKQKHITDEPSGGHEPQTGPGGHSGLCQQVPIRASATVTTRSNVVLPQRRTATQVVRPIGAPVAKSTVLTAVTIRRPRPMAHLKSLNN
ncbi:hypothetical protein BIW11_07669 [Tropilaelaps mercedesae]|uniref:Myb-like domain-containing protein n=1 Tax=Tropilaelaps mercedesae TaxID=418985 RepID=A0A1V9XT37_9ACAR|nr:hypothetical protein BIW11_07669 [Tropilaelaps mercedesae]